MTSPTPNPRCEKLKEIEPAGPMESQSVPIETINALIRDYNERHFPEIDSEFYIRPSLPDKEEHDEEWRNCAVCGLRFRTKERLVSCEAHSTGERACVYCLDNHHHGSTILDCDCDCHAPKGAKEEIRDAIAKEVAHLEAHGHGTWTQEGIMKAVDRAIRSL